MFNIGKFSAKVVMYIFKLESVLLYILTLAIPAAPKPYSLTTESTEDTEKKNNLSSVLSVSSVV